MELTPAQKFDATIRAAAAGDLCVCCFRLMPPGASVTMVRRQLRQPGRPSPFGRVPDGHASVAVPVCLDCTLSDYGGSRFPRVCSWACAYMVKLARSKVVRRVERFTEICDGCGERFVPKRSDARTCGNRCRQRLFRERRAMEAAP